MIRFPIPTALALAGALALVAAACGGGGPAAAPAEVAQGHDLFKKACATCHGANGEGMPRLGKNLNGNQFVSSLTDAEFVEFLRVGRPASHPDNERGVDMPPKGGNPALTDADLLLITAYVRSIQ